MRNWTIELATPRHDFHYVSRADGRGSQSVRSLLNGWRGSPRRDDSLQLFGPVLNDDQARRCNRGGWGCRRVLDHQEPLPPEVAECPWRMSVDSSAGSWS